MPRGISKSKRFNAAEFYVDRHLAEGRAHKSAVLYGNRRLDYAEVADQVNRAASTFTRAGLRRGDRLIVILFDSPAFVAAFWGAIKAGIIPIPSNTLLAPEGYELKLKDSGARGLIAESALAERVAPAVANAKRPLSLWSVGGSLPGARSFEDEIARASSDIAAAETSREDPAFWLYTSGSTGPPKASIHLHHNMVCCLETFGRHVLAIREGDVTFSASKLFFAYGLGNALHFPFGVGAATVLLPEKPTAEKFLAVLRKHRPSIIYGVPSTYASLLDAEGACADDFRSVRVASSAGEALPAPLWHRFREKFGIEIVDGIGSTEMLHTFISNRPGDIEPGSSGRPVPGYDVKIADERGRKLGDEEPGELWVRGDSAAAGYWRRPDLTRETFRGQWVRTGDTYRRDNRGYYWHAGRSDDMMKVKGLWVSPVEVESALLAHPDVLECAVIGGRDANGLIRPKAFVVLKPSSQGSTASEMDLLAFLCGQLPDFKVPRWIAFLPKLPRTATGKIQRFMLREKAGRE